MAQRTSAWASPSSGAVSFGWSEPFIVDGSEVPVAEFPRHDSPWGTVDRLAMQHRWERAGAVLELDFDTMARHIV